MVAPPESAYVTLRKGENIYRAQLSNTSATEVGIQKIELLDKITMRDHISVPI